MALPLRDGAPTRSFPWVTAALIVLNVVVFLFVQPGGFQDPPAEDTPVWEAYEREVEAASFGYRWGTVPCELMSGETLDERPDRCTTASPVALEDQGDKSLVVALVTCMFLHGSTMHLAGNMLFLWVFGNVVEHRVGWARYLALYLAGGIVATLGFTVVNPDVADFVIGASGAIAAVMGAYLVFHPRGRILTVVVIAAFQVVYVPAAVVLVLFFVTQFFTPDAQVAWEAHVAGMVAGVVAAVGLARLPSVRRRAEDTRADMALRAGSTF